MDTLFLVALVSPRDQYHKSALALSDTYESYSFITTDCVLLEVGNALARNFKAQAIDIINELQSSHESEVITLTPTLFTKGIQLYETHQDKSWGLVDCVSFVVMREADVYQALTFDQHFIQAGFEALMRS